MGTIYALMNYVMKFATDPSFQEEQGWVDWMMSKLYFIHHHLWTATRFFGWYLAVWAYLEYGAIAGAVVYGLVSLTDWVDGKVKRYRDRHNIEGKIGKNIVNLLEKVGINYNDEKFGNVFDGGADKIHIISPILYMIAGGISGSICQPLFFTMAFIDAGGQVFLWIKSRSLRKKGDERDLFEHLKVGKFKYAFQVLFVLLFFLSLDNSEIGWKWWPFWINLLVGTATLLTFFSVACKFNPLFGKYIADGITLQNVVCGFVAIFIGMKNFGFAAALIFTAGAFDALDGYVARRTGGSTLLYGDYKDSFADSVSFGLAPAMLLIYSGASFYVALTYFVMTCSRLAYYLRVHSPGGVFKGLPCPASGMMIASLLLWEDRVSLMALETVAVFVAILEVSFIFEFVFKKIQMKWYHVSLFEKVIPKKTMGSILVFFLVLAIIGRMEMGVTLLILLYVVFFYKPLADRISGVENEA
jgi:CDP-diacylglycerol--serine O-phosphatidyltransferase